MDIPFFKKQGDGTTVSVHCTDVQFLTCGRPLSPHRANAFSVNLNFTLIRSAQ